MIRLFHVSIPVSVLGLLISESALIFACFIFACHQELDIDTQTFLRDDFGVARIAAVALTFIFGAYLTDLYTQIRVRSKIVLVSRVMGIMGAALICEAVIGYVNIEWALPKSVVITGTIAALVVLSAWRILFSSAVMPAIGSQRILFLGAAPLALKISTKLLDHPELGMKTIGYLAPEAVESDLPCLGNPCNVADVVSDMKPDRVVIAMTERRGRLPMDALLDLRFAGVYIEEVAALYEEAFGRVSIDEIRPSQLILSTELGPRPWTVRVQAVYSTVLAAIGLLITAPILLIASLLVKLTSRGPIFYRQTRVGLRGEPFSVYKLRSMRQDAEAGTGAVWATQNDPRITAVGHFLRKSRLDELPQLFNVLRGEMSIVGPRPERPEFVRELNQSIPYYRQRHCVKPGITGWAQINHQYGDTLEHTRTKLEYDLYYIKNLSPSLDAYIMFQTVKIMLLSRGAQ